MSTTTTYAVTGMTCGHCEQSVLEEISELGGVLEVAADHTTGQFVDVETIDACHECHQTRNACVYKVVLERFCECHDKYFALAVVAQARPEAPDQDTRVGSD